MTSVTKEMLIPATLAAIDRLEELGHSGTPMGYKDLFLAMFPNGKWGTVHPRIIGEACKIWETKNQKTVDWILPTLRIRQRRGQWQSQFTTAEQQFHIELAAKLALAQRKRLEKRYGTDRVWAKAYLEFSATDFGFTSVVTDAVEAK